MSHEGERGSAKRCRRAVILDVAESHLALHGYLGVSLEAVASEVGISKPALYYHFPEGKEQLFVEIAHRSLQRVREGLEREMGRHESGAKRLGAATRWLMEQGERGHPMNEMRDVARFASEERAGGLAEDFYRAVYGPIRGVIAEAVESGEFRHGDPDLMTWAYLGLASGMLDVRGMSSEGDERDSGEMADEMARIFLEGALARGGS